MTRNSVCIVVLILVFCLVPASNAQKYGAVCFPDGGHPDWQLLIASLDGFCFHYPPIYKPVRFNSRVLALAQQLRPQAQLLFWLTNKPFKLEELGSLTPSGEAPNCWNWAASRSITAAPEAIRWATQTITSSTCEENSSTSRSVIHTSTTLRPTRPRTQYKKY